MAVDLLIDPATNDLGYRNGRIRYAVSGNETAQRVITRIRRLKGEWFIDTSAGMPYIQDILGKKDINYFINSNVEGAAPRYYHERRQKWQKK